MGNGIAHVAALAGFDVVLNDVFRRFALKSGMATIKRQICRAKSPRRSSRRTPASRRWSGSSPPRRSTGFADCDLVIESAVEKEEVKRKIFSQSLRGAEARGHRCLQHLVDLDYPACGLHGSSERFIGIHFMNPVPLMNWSN